MRGLLHEREGPEVAMWSLEGVRIRTRSRLQVSCSASLCLSPSLVDLVAERTCSILQVLLLHSGKRAKHDQLENEVGEGAKNDKVVEAGLDLSHL